MAAYAAVISLKHTIQRLLYSSRISIKSSSQEILKVVYSVVTSLQRVLERLDDSSSSSSERLNALDGQIREAAHKLEDVLESHISNQITNSQSESRRGDEAAGSSALMNSVDMEETREESNSFAKKMVLKLKTMLHSMSNSQSGVPESHGMLFSIDLQDLKQEIRSFIRTMKKMEEEYAKALDEDDLLPEEKDDDDDHDVAAASSDIDFGTRIVGRSDEFACSETHLRTRLRPDDFAVVTIRGRTGSGRTIAAKTVFEDLYVNKEQFFDCGAWVTIGPNYQLEDILVSILAQIDDGRASNDRKLLVSEGDEEATGEYLYTSLKGRRYMIVLDDICDKHIWNLLRSSFPEQNNGSFVLLTTRLMQEKPAGTCMSFQMPDMDDAHTWGLFCLAMFGEESCPPPLEEAGKKIVKNCRGLRISFAKVILFLSEAEKTPEYWNKIAADEENPIFMVDHEISEVDNMKEYLQHQKKQLWNRFAIDLATYGVDFSQDAEAMKIWLFPERFFPRMILISYIGMAGIGKTTLAKELFKNPSIMCYFDHHVWVRLGPKYQSKEILVDILAQVYPATNKMRMKEDEELTKDLCQQLSDKKCLIVLDDVWNIELLFRLKELFPNIKGIALVTTRLEDMALLGNHDIIFNMKLLNKEDSWCLLCQKVFDEELCPPQLEKVGKKIADNCEGLPLMIVTVADLLSKAEKTLEYWNKVAEKQNSVFMDAYDKISKALLPSFTNLPQVLKVCFLYMGIFHQNCEIPRSKLINLWIAEGFHVREDFAINCLVELCHKNLVMVCRKGSNSEIKTCILHSVFWHLSNKEATRNMFFHALNSCADNLIEDIESPRRLCIRNSILLAIKDVHNSISSILNMRSLVYTGPPHPYPVPICLGSMLLRVLDALIIRLYEFPDEVVKLIHLGYLALTCDGKLPDTISKLWNIQYLIINRHLSIKSSIESSYLPGEIWDMKKLKHLQIRGSNLPDPCGAVLPNLLTLLNVSAHSCTKRVLKGIPNLNRLGIQIELAPDEDDISFHCLNHISSLHRLESLKCVIVNPKLKCEVVAPPPAPVSMFPSGLKKLSLSGLAYPWEYMNIIGQLENLEVLKLRCYAFQGPKLEADCFTFNQLKFFLIEDTDLVCWKYKMHSFRRLEYLSIKHCYRLEELPCYFSDFMKMIEVVDCNPLTVAWANQMEEKAGRHPISSETLELKVYSSWDIAENLKQ